MKMSEYLARGLVETEISPEGFLLMIVRQPDGSYQTKVIASDNVGARGAVGPQGDQGAPGVNGTNGQNGADGVAGPTGATGTTGAAGPVGPVGPAGASGTASHSVLAYAASVDLDFAATDDFHTVTLAGNITFTTSNRTAVKFITVRIIGDGSSRTLTFPAGWKFLGAAAPTALAANKTGVLSLSCFGTNDSDVVAAYSAQL